jgi:hypothetical protein
MIDAEVAQLLRRMDAGIDEVTAVGDRTSAVRHAKQRAQQNRM